MQFAHGFETVYPYFIEKYPELFHISRETFAGVFDDIDLHPSEITEYASIFLNYLFCFFVLFDNTYTTSKGKTCTGWEVLKTDKSIKIDPKAKSILNKINKAKWKVFRVKRRTMISWQGYLREVKLDKRLESFGPEYKISFDEFSPIARDNDLVLAKVHETKSSYSIYFKIPLDRNMLLDFVATHKSIIEEANEQNMQLISEEKELLDQIIRKQLAIASSLFTKVAYSRFEPKNYEYLKSVNSNFLKHSWEFILGKNTSSAGIGEIKILNFRKFLKIINKTKNIESFGDYSHVFMSDEDEPRVLAKLMIDEDEKVLRIEEISENSSALVLSFLKTKASDFVDVKDIQTSPSNSFKSFKSSEIPNLAEELNLPGSLFDNINSPEDLIRAIELDVARKQKLLLGFVSEDFGFPIISYFARQDGGLKAMWKEFAINKPSRTKLLDSKSYLGVFLEYILTEISFQDKSSTIPMVERIIQKKKSIMKKEVIDFYRAIMKADYLLFKIENYDQATNDFIIRDLNTDSLLPAQHLDNPIALFEPGKIFVAKKVTWNQKNVLTYFLLSYPANYRKKLQKLFNEKSEEILFSDSNLVRFSDRLIELHCESQNANLGEFPLK